MTLRKRRKIIKKRLPINHDYILYCNYKNKGDFKMNYIKLNKEEFDDIKTGSLNYLVGQESFWSKFQNQSMIEIIEIVDAIKETKSIKRKLFVRNNVIKIT